MRFRKSITICKGVKLNFSKSGVTATVGGKGISANLGKQGVFLNTSLPGTGIYDRKRIVNFNNMDLDKLSIGGLSVGSLLGGDAKKPGKTSTKPAAARPEADMPESIQLELADDGSILVYDQDGMPVEDRAVLAKLRSTASYRASCEQLIRAEMDAFNAETEAFVNIGQLSEDVLRPDEYERALRSSRPETAKPEPFPDPEPTREGTRVWLEAEAKKNVTGFFNVDKKREDYVRTRLADAFLDEHDAWARRKADYEAEQQEKVEAENERLEREYEARMEMLRAGLDGDRDAVEDQIEAWLRTLEVPIDFDVDYEYDAETGVLMVDMDLPEIQHLPTQKMVEMSSGKLKTKEKTQKELKQEYARCVFGLGMFCASHFFNVTPHMERILLSGYTQRRDAKTGDMNDEYIYTVIFERSAFERSGYQQKEPLDFICKFKNRMNLTANGDLKQIEPYGVEMLDEKH